MSHLAPAAEDILRGEESILAENAAQRAPDEPADNSVSPYDVAIVGMAGRFPGATNTDALWRNLVAGIESIRTFSDAELEAEGIDPELWRAPDYVKAGTFISDTESFDAALFGLTPRETEIMDPQHRLFLECAWEALEDAGYPPGECDLPVGVYAGTFMSSYLFQVLSNPRLVASVGELAIRHGNEKDYLATRTSYRLNLKGPSFSVQTACSTSLVAVHLAYQGLIHRECDLALAGGVALRVPQIGGYVYEPGGALSHDGHCRPFDAEASGTIFGQGAGVVVLQRLADALAAGHEIYAVIKGSAINNDGSAKVGFTAPSVDGQAAVIAEALAMSGVDPETITYVETHGTGTALGDPIEVAALTQAYRTYTERTGYCGLGSVKGNFGHLSAAAGVTGLIKAALMIRHGQIPASLYFETPNPRIDFASSPFYVNRELRPWLSAPGRPRRAGVSSFGIGGTNAHAVLEQAPSPLATAPGQPIQLLLLSARTASALERRTDDLVAALDERPEVALADVAFTLERGRPRLPHRRMLVAHGVADARRALAERDPERVLSFCEEAKDRPVVFLFPGEGHHHVNMGRGLYEREPRFRAEIDRAAELLVPTLGMDLRTVLYPADSEAARAEATAALRQGRVAQPALFAVSYAMAQLWRSWGIEPQAVFGQSLGEYVGACLAGVFSLADALRVVAARGRLGQSLPPGSMLSIPLPPEQIEPHLDARLAISAINAPQSCLISGQDEAVTQLAERLAADGVSCRRIHLSFTSHCPMVDPILEAFAEELSHATYQPPAKPVLSSLTGTWLGPDEGMDAAYWTRQLRSPVRCAEALAKLLEEPEAVLLEVGPGRTLSSLVRQQPGGAARLMLTSMRHPKDQESDRGWLLTSLGRLWMAGVAVDGAGRWADEPRRRLRLPTYPFERQRYWVEPGRGPATRTGTHKRGRDDVSFLPAWTHDRPLPPLSEGSGADRWLLLSDDDGVGEALADALRRRDRTVFTATPGQGFAARGERRFVLDALCPGDYDALLEAVRDQGGALDRIVDLRGIRRAPRPADDGMAEAAHQAFFQLLYLAQALGRSELERPLHLTVVTTGLHDVVGDEPQCPETATVLGPCLAMAQEVAELSCRNVDVRLPEVLAADGVGIALLLAEAETADGEPVVAHRSGRRWRRAFHPVSLAAAGAGITRLRRGGRYLITGGFGGLGHKLAEHLAAEYQARLILTGRSPLPPRDAWDEAAAASAEADAEAQGVARRIRGIRQLEAQGAEVLAVGGVDVGDRAAVAALVAEARDRFGGLDGVFHAAGLPGGGVLQRARPEEVATVLAPKVDGSLALVAALADEKPDFLVLFSSTTAVTGGFGRADYCAANCFLDALAASQPLGPETFTVAVNWCTWKSLGLALMVEETYGAEEGIATLEPALGIEVLMRLLGDRLSRVVVAAQEVGEMIALRSAAGIAERIAAYEQDAAMTTSHPRPTLATAYIAPNTPIERQLVAIWEGILGINEVGVHDNFFELGGTSLTGLRVMAGIRKELGVEIPAVSLYEGPTISSLARIIEHKRPGAQPGPEEPADDARRARGARRRQRSRQRKSRNPQPVTA